MSQIDAPHSSGDSSDEYYGDFVEELQLMEAIECDDKVKFVALAGKMDPRRDPVVCPDSIWQKIFSSGAVNCAAALLNAETKYYLDINTPDIDGTGVYPLHLATFDLNYSMVDFLLRRAARTDVRTISCYYVRGNLLPLNIALELIRYHQYLVNWTPKDSIFKLIFLLCLPQLRDPLETCRLLARRTEEVHKIFLDYALEGKLIEMAVFLMVAHFEILGLGDDIVFPDLAGGVSIRDCILFEIAKINEEQIKSLTERKSTKSAKLCMKKNLLEKSLLLLDVLGRTAHEIDLYFLESQRDMPKETLIKVIKKLIETSGYVLKDIDTDLSDIGCDSRESEAVKLSTSTPEANMPISPQAQGSRVPVQHWGNFKGKREVMDPRVTMNFLMSRYFPDCSSIVPQGFFPGQHFSSGENMHSQAKCSVAVAESSPLLSPKRVMFMFRIIKRGLWHI